MNEKKQLDDFLKLIDFENDDRMRECTTIKDGHLVLDGQDLNFIDDSTFTHLPKDLELQFWYGAMPALEIIRCHNYKILEYITVEGNHIYIESCDNFVEIGMRVNARGGIEMTNVPMLEKISTDLKVDNFLKISRALLLEEIPLLEYSSCSVLFDSCPLLKEIPEGFMNGKIEGDLEVRDCLSLEKLPTKLSLTHDLEIENCPKLTTLPSELKIGGGLYLKTKNPITTLPEGLLVKGDAALMGCTFASLPKKVEIGGNIYIHPEIDKDILDWIKAWKDQGMIKGEIKFST
ncbi:MAG: hypothetical protein ACK4NC_04370 [Candidatus Gracilibacteria bacterium]